jgi:Flp pilus assembly protein TadG
MDRLRRSSAKIQWFVRDTRAHLTLIFALALVPMAITAGGMLDFSRLAKSRSSLANIADSAVLAGVNDRVVTAAIPWADQKAASEKAMKDTFALFLATNKDTSLTLTADTYTVSYANNVVTAKICYTAVQSNSLLQFAGMTSNTFSGCTTAESAPPTYFSVNFLVDASGSMGIGATAADQTLMNTKLGCAFACHTTDALAPCPQPTTSCAKAIGAKTRFDVVRSAIATVLNEAKATQTLTDQFSFSVHKFSNTLTEVAAASQDANAVATKVTAMAPDAKGAGTNLRAALASMASKITVGDGKSPNSRKAFLLILTDGVEGNVNEYEQNGAKGWRTYGNWTPDPNLTVSNPGFYSGPERSQAVDPTMCNAMKAKGVTVLTLHTEYLTPVGSTDYRFQQIQSQLKPVIATRLRDCASTADFAFNASSPDEIKTGTQKMLAAVLAKAHLTQ